MKFITAFAGALLLLTSAAQAAPPLVNPVIVNIGTPVHLTPVDQNNQPIPIAQCSIPISSGINAAYASHIKDATGFVITGIAPGTSINVKISCTDGVNPAVLSSGFSVTVPAPPYAVTAVGSTSP